MSPNFCFLCRNILDNSKEDTVKCGTCGETNQSLYYLLSLKVQSLILLGVDVALSQTRTSSTNNFPLVLLERLASKTQTIMPKDFESTKWISQECLQCHAAEVTWSEAQLRSADEGSTIFSRCLACRHRYGRHICHFQKQLLILCRWQEGN